MGDMKTPDFDDLLAAFDIPDATGLDAKEPLQGGHEETESQLKHTGICLDDSLLGKSVPTTDIPAVSVIVKNTSCQESLEGFGPALQNGFRGQESSNDCDGTTNTALSKSFVSALNGEDPRGLLGKAPIQHKPDGTPIFSQSRSHFSPISSPESEDAQSSRVQEYPNQEKPCFPETSVLVEPLVADHSKNLDLSMFGDCPKASDILKSKERTSVQSDGSKEPPDISADNEMDKTLRIHSALPPPNSTQSFTDTNGSPGTTVDTLSALGKSQTSKLSSCLEALVALNARKDPREPSTGQNECMKASPNVPISPRSPRSPLEAVKRLVKPSDSPVSICSDSSGKASPAVASGSPAAIPRVRIKTIKTTSGQIKRTVTSVLPDSETDDIHSAYESSPSQSMISEDSYCNMSPHQSHGAVSDSTVGTQAKVFTASAPSQKVINNRSEANSRKTSKSQSATLFHSTSGPVKLSSTHHKQKTKRGSAALSQTTGTNFLPKAMHLASLNLVPHSVAASVAARSSSHHPSKHTLSSTVYSTVPLVHQIKTAKPYPHTSIHNTAAGTLNRLLNNSNPLPTYVPNLNPPAESNISLPPRGYCCLECGDSFGVERSLTYHYSRRSVHIEVGCTHCSKTMVFFNKCALLAHAREHKSNGMVMQCTQLHMKPIAEEQMFVPLSAEPLNVDSSPSPLLKSQPVLPLYPDHTTRHRLRCLECNKQLPDHKALAGHYQRPSEDVEGLTCQVCSMLLPNKCSFRAHGRIHSHKSPYCCPECGAVSRSADIQKHVKENCLHYARKAWYKCLHCDMVFKTLQGQKTHVEEKHCEVFYKCSICPVAFKTPDSCEVHLNIKHNASKTSPQLIFKCSCETIFKKKQLLLQHFHQNANKRVTCVFKCPECNSVFPQKQLLMQHFKGVHIGTITAESENPSSQTSRADWHQDVRSSQQHKSPSKHTENPRKKTEQDERRVRVKPTGWTCGECLQFFPERDSYVSHVKTKHGKSIRKYPCRHCEQSFNSATSLRRHIRSDHDGKKKIYTCWYCTDSKTIFTTSVMLKNHISLMHGIKNPDLSQMPKTAVQESKKALRKGHVLERPAMDDQKGGQDCTSSLEAPSAKRLKTHYRCSKCGFVTDDSTKFQQHIPQHKTDENTPQCLHCGLCFTSVLSLNRHLFIVHKIKKPEEEDKEEKEAVTVKVREKEQESEPDGYEDTDEVKDLLPEFNEPEPLQADEPAGLHCDRTADSNLKLSTHSQKEAVSLNSSLKLL
ncbi:zinc finger protein 592 [Xyrichtys novacula]|uniref:Zinc finger protein 592 n=1 Tax=Xyrichtys novacula TaxID=13765 RepID=A0AAV1F6S8_XYRNO|nr:zinc finger protein 592 [Xyrichtys novacula]